MNVPYDSPTHTESVQKMDELDSAAIEEAIDAIIAAEPEKAAQAKAKPTMLGWFVGQVMKQTGGKADPALVGSLLDAKLAELAG